MLFLLWLFFIGRGRSVGNAVQEIFIAKNLCMTR